MDNWKPIETIAGKLIAKLDPVRKDRNAIMGLWEKSQNTHEIGRLLNRPENQVERVVHSVMDKRYLVRHGLRGNHHGESQ